ncbi:MULTISPECIES: hypothetical protein [Burkholderia]|uniref:Uncharacterized protein n=1 Tax=Burkholderia sola TaxID=2843302 RepID=A0ABV2C270_9BURK|nr:hypothetical protein [Burkholderia sp. CpTa8-5]MBP0605295.1 hypothetical protein [Burkholderia sp. CpTa8-5]
MVMGSVSWWEGLGLVRHIVQRYALQTGCEQGFGNDATVAVTVLNGRTMPLDIAGRPGKLIRTTG